MSHALPLAAKAPRLASPIATARHDAPAPAFTNALTAALRPAAAAPASEKAGNAAGPPAPPVPEDASQPAGSPRPPPGPDAGSAPLARSGAPATSGDASSADDADGDLATAANALPPPTMPVQAPAPPPAPAPSVGAGTESDGSQASTDPGATLEAGAASGLSVLADETASGLAAAQSPREAADHVTHTGEPVPGTAPTGSAKAKAPTVGTVIPSLLPAADDTAATAADPVPPVLRAPVAGASVPAASTASAAAPGGPAQGTLAAVAPSILRRAAAPSHIDAGGPEMLGQASPPTAHLAIAPDPISADAAMPQPAAGPQHAEVAPPMAAANPPAAPEAAAPNPAPAPAAPPPAPAQLAPVFATLAPAAQPGAPQQLVIRLDPAELGHVQVRIERPVDGPAHVVLAVERADTLMLLMQDRPQLNQALTAAGLAPEGRTLQFSLSSGSGQNAGQSFSGQSSFGQSSGGGQRDTARRQPTRAAWLRPGIDITA